MRIGVALTCHDRRERTLSCLGRVAAQTGHGSDLDIVVVDAGSSDGTATAVADRFPAAEVIRTGADVYWNAGMRLALARAATRDPDHYLWLNDDTDLDPGALARLLETSRWAGDAAIVVGSVRDPVTGTTTYGGVTRPRTTRPLHFALVEPGGDPRPGDTMNGNCVLVPRAVARRVGELDPAFSHGMGDFDYGLRAAQAGVPVWIAPGTVGTCARNAPARPARGPLRELRRLRGPKGLPPAEWLRFARRWGGPLWPVYGTAPYVLALSLSTLALVRPGPGRP